MFSGKIAQNDERNVRRSNEKRRVKVEESQAEPKVLDETKEIDCEGVYGASGGIQQHPEAKIEALL